MKKEPKPETMWMAWHPGGKFNLYWNGYTKKTCQLIIDNYAASPSEWQAVKVQITEIQPKKRGEG
jgi:hypothetical protein